MMKHSLLIAGLLLLSACAPVASNEEARTLLPPLPKLPIITQQKEQLLEQVPAELSVEYFSKMRLSGTGLTLGTVLDDNAAYTRYSITYFSNGLKISGIMNIPKGEGPFPLVVLNHGYIAPSVYTNGRGLKREQDYLARQGFAVIHPDYRGYAFSDESPDERMIYDASLEYSMDSANAILAVRDADIPNIDAKYVGMLGHSLGGGITLNIAVAHPELLDAIILYASVHSDAWENFMKWRDRREEGDLTREMMGTREENPEKWDALSSLTLLDRITSPVLLFHGTNDESVPKEWSDFLAGRLRELDNDVTYIEYEGEKHEFIPKWDDFMRRTAAFLHERFTEEALFVPPLDRSDERVTKKPFGIYITPETSPVQPEKFTGYHTGTDFELSPGESAHDIEVRAICRGEVIYKNRVSGYGGVLVQRCIYKGETVTVLYGHLSLDSISANVGTQLKAGDRMGVFGEEFTEETDGERAHLHLGIHRGGEIEFRGYVGNEGELEGWVDT
ncbi:alpha/beta fold hydrolase [Patescibacteria group bacterium]|nr:alpha/beta fold hydrolase [Patescibacteria group bacterium]